MFDDRQLLDNAFKFSKPDHLTGALQDDQYVLTIQDHGRGLRLEQIANIGACMQFERGVYEQAGGLGLVLAKRLAEFHDGQRHIQSEPGRVTTVKIVLHQGKEWYPGFRSGS